MRIAALLFLFTSALIAQDVVLDLEVYVGSYDAKEAGSVDISLPEWKLTPTNGPTVAEDIMKTFHLKSLDLVSAPRMEAPLGRTIKALSKLNDETPPQVVAMKFKTISMDQDVAHISFEFSTDEKNYSGAEMMVKMGKPFTLSSRLDGRLAFLIGTLNPANQTGETPPRVLKKEGPAYPQDLRDAKVQGMVAMKLRIDEKGKVLKCEKAKADDDRFVAPACEAAMKWEFEPGKKDGKAIAMDYFVTMSFRLD